MQQLNAKHAAKSVHLHPPPEVLGCPRDLRLLAHDLADPHEVDELLLRQVERRPVTLGAIGGTLAAGVPAPGQDAVVDIVPPQQLASRLRGAATTSAPLP